MYFTLYLLKPNPWITTGETGRGGRRSDPWPLRPSQFHPEAAACRGEAAPRPYFLLAYPHVIDGLGLNPNPLITTGETGRGAWPCAPAAHPASPGRCCL